jgi:hypothetical protein
MITNSLEALKQRIDDRSALPTRALITGLDHWVDCDWDSRCWVDV